MPLEALAPSRVQETTTTTGITSPLILNGAVTKYRTFNSAVPNGSLVYYAIISSDGSEWEEGIGTFTSPNQLARTTIKKSSNANSIVNFSAGIKTVTIAPTNTWGDDLIEESKRQATIMTLALS